MSYNSTAGLRSRLLLGIVRTSGREKRGYFFHNWRHKLWFISIVHPGKEQNRSEHKNHNAPENLIHLNNPLKNNYRDNDGQYHDADLEPDSGRESLDLFQRGLSEQWHEERVNQNY